MDINRKGIAPDIQINISTQKQMELNVNPDLLGTSGDPQYAQAIKILRGNPLNQ